MIAMLSLLVAISIELALIAYTIVSEVWLSTVCGSALALFFLSLCLFLTYTLWSSVARPDLALPLAYARLEDQAQCHLRKADIIIPTSLPA